MIICWVEDSLKKVFQDDGPSPAATSSIALCAAKNEREDVQICLRASKPVGEITYELSDLTGPGGAVISASCITADFVVYVPVFANTADNGNGEHIIRKAPAFFPDGFCEWSKVALFADQTQPLWVTIAVPEDATPGDYNGKITLIAGEERIEVAVSLEVWPFALPKKSSMWMTNWFTTSCLEEWYSVKKFSDEWWNWMEKVAKNMGEHRQNVILTPLFSLVKTTQTTNGFTYDYANLDRWIELYDSYGAADRIEGSHLGHRCDGWESIFVFGSFPLHDEHGNLQILPSAAIDDPERRALLKDFLLNLLAHLEQKGWLDRFIMHQADEPIPPNEETYRQLADFVKEVMPDIPRIDAVMAHGLRGLIEIRVPQIQEFSDDYDPTGEELWSYTCLAPQGPYPNRFLDFSSLKTRIIPWVNWRYGAVGYLHWGYAHWSGWNGAVGPVDPWGSTTGASERHPVGKQILPPGDTHVVYPGQEKICNSVRWEMVRRGCEDYEYFVLMEQGIAKLGENHPAAIEAKALLDEIRSEIVPDNATYTRCDAALMDARKRMAKAIITMQSA